MKKAFISLILIVFAFSATQAQEETEKYGKIGENLKIGLEFISDYWPNAPQEMDASVFNRGFNMNIMWDEKLGKSPMSLGIGVGLSSHNLYSNKTVLGKNQGVNTFVVPEGELTFSDKLNLTYVDVPFELRYKFKFGLHINTGFKAGYLISSNHKYEGNGTAVGLDNENVKVKFKDLSYIEPLRYGPTFRIGYKWINLTAYYQLSDIFKLNEGPTDSMAPITFGIAVIPF